MKADSKHSVETRAKMSAAKAGKPLSAEHRAKLSANHADFSGENHPMFGKHHTTETRAKISANHADLSGERSPMFGKHHTAETRAKISVALSGEKHPLYGKHRSTETCAKMSAAKRGEKSPNFGKPLSAEIRAKLSVANSGEKNYNYGKHLSAETRAKLSAAHIGKMSGENHPNWRGGISFEPYCPKFDRDLRRRIRAFFEDQCVPCGKSATENKRALSCHHIEYNKDACCDGKPVQFAALCIRHHGMTNGRDRQRWEDMLHRIIDEIYGGRSYYTKEEWAEINGCTRTLLASSELFE